MGHARALLPLDGAEQILRANEIVAKKLSVREAERLVGRHAGSRGARPPATRVGQAKARDIQRLEHQLSDLLAAQVEIRMRGRGTGAGDRGEIAIAFTSLDVLNGLLSRLGLESS
jgi:ParB family chromosome partitioning protein